MLESLTLVFWGFLGLLAICIILIVGGVMGIHGKFLYQQRRWQREIEEYEANECEADKIRKERNDN